jgi:hypothetical protein
VTKEEQADATPAEPPKKKQCALFGHYRKENTNVQGPSAQLTKFIEKINADNYVPSIEIFSNAEFNLISTLFERLFCVPASSAPVERIFSQSGIIMRSHRARMSNKLLEELVFLKCNNTL